MNIRDIGLPQLQFFIQSAEASVTEGLNKNPDPAGTASYGHISDSFLTEGMNESKFVQSLISSPPDMSPSSRLNDIAQNPEKYKGSGYADFVLGGSFGSPVKDLQKFTTSLSNLNNQLGAFNSDQANVNGMMIANGKLAPIPPRIVPGFTVTQPSPPPILPGEAFMPIPPPILPGTSVSIPTPPPIMPQFGLSDADQRAIIIVGGKFGGPSPPPIIPDASNAVVPQPPPIHLSPTPPPIIPAFDVFRSQMDALQEMQSAVQQSVGLHAQISSSMLTGRTMRF
jgi:hypothetical protein